MNDENSAQGIPTNTPAAAPSPDGNGAGATDAIAGLSAKLVAASNAAVASFNADQKRKPGQRGPDKAPRKKPVRVEKVDGGTGSLPLGEVEDLGAGDDGGLLDGGGGVESNADESIRAFVSGARALAEGAAQLTHRIIGEMALGDDPIVERNVRGAVMPSEIKLVVENCGFIEAKKHWEKLSNSPAVLLWSAIGLWVGGNALVALRTWRAGQKLNAPPQ